MTAADYTPQKISEPERQALAILQPEAQRRNVKKDRASVRDNTRENDSEEERKSIWQKKLSEERKVEMFQN